jgi:hypothetical protein
MLSITELALSPHGMYHNPNSGKTCRDLMQSTTEHTLISSDSNLVARHTRVCQSRVWPMSVMSVRDKSVQQQFGTTSKFNKLDFGEIVI